MPVQPPLVSISLPTYNGSKYLAQSIESCLAQTYQNWELIIVDDCSTDATPQIIAEYSARDPRIRGIRHETNKKLPGGLNTGHAAARGQYLTWTSDDNLYRPQALAEMVSFLESHPDIGMVYCDYTEIDDAGAVIRQRTVAEPSGLAFYCTVGACFLYRREVSGKIGVYRDDLFCAEDFEYWMRVSQHFRIATLHKDLYLYRLHGGSLTATRQDRMLQSMKNALVDNLPRMHWAGRTPVARGWLSVASIAARRRELGDLSRALGKAMWYSPHYTLWHAARGAFRRIARKLSPGAKQDPGGSTHQP